MALRNTVKKLKTGDEDAMWRLLTRLRLSRDWKYSTDLLGILLLLPDSIIENSAAIDGNFSKRPFLEHNKRERILLCRHALFTCFRPYVFDDSRLVTREQLKQYNADATREKPSG